MQISSRFTIAIHMFVAIDTFQDTHKVTSDFLANSVNVNPVIIRKIFQQLKEAGLIEVARGSGGVKITRPLNEITFLDVFNAVESIEDHQLFHFHENPNMACPVGRNIHFGLDSKLQEIQNSMEEQMRHMTIADVVKDTQYAIHHENA